MVVDRVVLGGWAVVEGEVGVPAVAVVAERVVEDALAAQPPARQVILVSDEVRRGLASFLPLDTAGRPSTASMPDPSWQRCAGPLAPFDALTSTNSHEVREAIPDPCPSPRLVRRSRRRDRCRCAWKTTTVGSYTVQLEWPHPANAFLNRVRRPQHERER